MVAKSETGKDLKRLFFKGKGESLRVKSELLATTQHNGVSSKRRF
jgi:hypothetical protein